MILQPPESSRSDQARGRLWLCAILLLALGLRLGWAASRPVSPGQLAALPDQIEYLSLARNLLSGQGLSFVDPRFDDRVYAFRTAGYPMFVAAFGANVRAVRIGQAVLDAGTVLAAFVLARQLMPSAARAAPLLAAGFVALNPFLVYFCGLVLSETLFVAMLSWGMVLLLAGNAGPDRRARASVWLGGGLVLALAALVRPSAAPLPILLGLAAAFVNVQRGRPYQAPWPISVGATMLLLVLLVMTPWAVRNYRVLHRLIWADTNAGFTLYDGYNPNATGASDQRFVRAMPQLRLMDEVDRSAYLLNRAKAYAAEHPNRIWELAWAKARRTWSPLPLSDQFGKPIYRLIAGLYAIPLDLLVLFGIWRGRLGRSTKVFLLAPAVYLTVVHALTIGSMRYRLPAEPMLAILAASSFLPAAAEWKRHAGGSRQ